MSVPMAAWMVYRGMGWRNSSEMAAAMVVPVIPFLCLVWFNVTKSAQCGGYCLIVIAAMLGLMLYRRAVRTRWRRRVSGRAMSATVPRQHRPRRGHVGLASRRVEKRSLGVEKARVTQRIE